MSDKMSLRDYRDYARSKYGKKSVNETTLKMMEKAVGSSGSKADYNRANANIKIAQALNEGRK